MKLQKINDVGQYVIELIVQSPLQQGLKQNSYYSCIYLFFSYRTKSITTRIETIEMLKKNLRRKLTYRTKSITTRIETCSKSAICCPFVALIVQSPLQQGLKQEKKEKYQKKKKKLIVQSPLQQGLKLPIYDGFRVS